MRFKFDKRKSEKLRRDRRRRIGFEEVQELFDQDHYLEQRNDLPEQWIAIGCVRGRLVSVIFEYRTDEEGEYLHLVTLWPASKPEQKFYEKNKI
ncbi:MAG: hypothetical protein JWQ35_1445 [Bacteriovoracaceae bacterium]|nr:hypothetical protein [Bacteriovoracaceae bacterium]